MDGRGRGKPRSFDEDSSGRRKEDRRKPGDKPIQAKVKSKQVTDVEDQLNGHALQNNRYHQREVPPRFQLQKQAKNTQKYIIKANQAVTKKPSKDATRWTSDPHTHTSSQDHTHSTPAHTPADDGGWSTGLPAKGSGWRKAASESSSLNEWGQDKKSPHDEVVGGWEGETKGKSDDSWGPNGHSEGGWTSDQDEGSSRSQSPGGIVMVVRQTTPSKENAGGWESKQVGSNWKMHTLDTKPADEKQSSEEGSVSNWTNQESSEKEPTNQRTSLSDSTTSNDASNRQDSSHTKPVSQNPSGSSTPTQEVAGVWRSGRTSANSTSSLTEVNGVKVKGGSRSASPRKMMNRYDPVSSNPNSLGRGAGLILPRPRKSIAELEGGLESLHNAPSGWGTLPSPKGDENDKGTEFWGIPPDDLVKMTGGTEQPPIINGWSDGGSRSPNPKVAAGEYSADSAGWSSNENAGKGGWGDEKVPPTDSGSYYESSGSITPSGSQPHLYTPQGGPLDTPTTDYPHKQPKWSSLDDQKDSSFQPVYGGQQMMQNQLIVKDLVLRYQQLAKLQLGQMSSGNIQSLQKSLSQQLNQAQAVRQKLVSQAPPTGIPSNHPLKVQLSQTTDIIQQLKQLLSQSQQMLSQQNPYTARVKPEMRQHTRYTESGTEISYGIRDMALSQQRPQGIHTSRSMSKLQRLISNQEDMTESSYGTNSPAYTSFTPFSPSFRSSSATTMTSSSLASKPVHQIQEFKPGVLWQPRKSEPAVKPTELYNPGAPQRSISTSTFGQQGRFGGGGGQRFTRSMSTDNNHYGGNQAPPTPTQGDHPWSNAETRAQTFSGRNWSNVGQRPGRISLPSTPVGALPDHSGWRQPPSTLLPNQYKQFESSRSGRASRGTPIDAHPEWFPETPTSADPVWGSGVGRSDQGSWPQSKSGQGWSQSEPLKESFPNTPSGEGRWSENVFTDWQSEKRRSTTAPLSPWLVVRTNSPQLNIQTLKDACKGFGDVKSFIEGSDFVLVGYGSVEEAIQTKSNIESLWGGQATAEVVPEGELENVWQQNDVPKANPPSSLHPSLLLTERGPQQSGVFKWEDPNKAFSYNRQASTPGGSSVWSDGGFLSGISSPWSSDFSGTLTSPSTGYQSDDLPSVTATPEERTTTQGSSLSTYLPNGLL